MKLLTISAIALVAAGSCMGMDDEIHTAMAEKGYNHIPQKQLVIAAKNSFQRLLDRDDIQDENRELAGQAHALLSFLEEELDDRETMANLQIPLISIPGLGITPELIMPKKYLVLMYMSNLSYFLNLLSLNMNLPAPVLSTESLPTVRKVIELNTEVVAALKLGPEDGDNRIISQSNKALEDAFHLLLPEDAKELSPEEINFTFVVAQVYKKELDTLSLEEKAKVKEEACDCMGTDSTAYFLLKTLKKKIDRFLPYSKNNKAKGNNYETTYN